MDGKGAGWVQEHVGGWGLAGVWVEGGQMGDYVAAVVREPGRGSGVPTVGRREGEESVGKEEWGDEKEIEHECRLYCWVMTFIMHHLKQEGKIKGILHLLSVDICLANYRTASKMI